MFDPPILNILVEFTTNSTVSVKREMRKLLILFEIVRRERERERWK